MTSQVVVADDASGREVFFIVRVDVETIGPASTVGRRVACGSPLDKLNSGRLIKIRRSEGSGLAQPRKEQAPKALEQVSGTHCVEVERE